VIGETSIGNRMTIAPCSALIGDVKPANVRRISAQRVNVPG